MIPAVKARSVCLLFLTAFSFLCGAYRYDPAYKQYNLNQNKNAIDPLDYWGEWTGHTYTPSPRNWRFPFYTLFLDRFVNGDPTNDNSNGTSFEHDTSSNQMRHGGDLAGLVDTLDYLQGMGVKALYIAGSPFINQPWTYDQYSPLDLSILDPHFGTIATWRSAIDEIHAHGMYVVLDNTFATMGDLIGFNGYLNTTTPFTLKEHKVQWKTDRHYWDFDFGNNYNDTCAYPRFWNETGYRIDKSITDRMASVGCYDSEFDQYGDTEAFGVFPDWRRELSKFASVQDRLREWHTPVREKIENFYCIAIAQLDIDGYRYDKATQSTPDAMGFMNDAMRKCATRFGKDNFFLPGEITGGNDFGSIFIGRGRQPDQLPDNLTEAIGLTTKSVDDYVIRDRDLNALDGGAFHYTTYRTLTRFLGMDGNLEAGYDAPANWVDQWNTFLLTNDMVNANTGEFDPRHMFGVTNQDVFRWPAIKNGVERQLLGHFVTSILMPGIPLLLWGEEQAFYILDNTASNYIFGRQPISAASAWQTHGCYSLNSTQYFEMPWGAARDGCNDDTVSYDHRDPSAPVRNIIRRIFRLRDAFPVLNDGFFLQQLSNQTENVVYPGSSGVITETGMWSVMRSTFSGQSLSDSGSDTPVWLVYSNANRTMDYKFNCKNNDTALNITALIAPYDEGTTVKNLFYPYDEHTLESSQLSLGIDGSTKRSGCLGSLTMQAYDFKAYVPVDDWISPEPMITKFSPGHDARIVSKVASDKTEKVDVELQFSTEMDCDSVTNSITFNSTTDSSVKPSVDRSSVKCEKISPANGTLVGQIQSSWSWTATLANVANGVHGLTVRNASTANGQGYTDANDRFLFRIGQSNNPVVFPRSANYSSTLLRQKNNDALELKHSAAGADMFRYSTNFGSSFSDWMPYQGGIHSIKKQSWSGTSLQAWKGEHVRVEYFSKLGGTSDHVQQSDIDSPQRRFPHMFFNGPYNAYGYDAGLNNEVKLISDNTWEHNWMVEWSANGSLAQLNIWGINPDGKPDMTGVLGDIDGDSVLDRLPPSSLSSVVLNITTSPPKPYLSWKFVINDGDLRFKVLPSGSMWTQLILYILLWTVPIITASVSSWMFVQSFYKVKFNKIGVSEKVGLIPLVFKRPFQRLRDNEEEMDEAKAGVFSMIKHRSSKHLQRHGTIDETQGHRRTVLIATMEYDIEDWAIKIKIGGLGVMAQLMGKNLGHQDLIWVVPCVGGIDYPIDEQAEPMSVTIMGTTYEVQVQYHTLRNITYVLLDAPIFRQQTKSDPYPARMDDMESAIYYSAWNQCIAQAITRFPIDLYHINDYHGTIAPLYLLPRTLPACLSLHNAEFQGLWPMRTKKEREEVCSVYNLSQEVVAQYVQFGEIFNLLHAGASYLRIHQQGFGAVGVSNKYGKRAYARYPIFWGLKKVQGLPNPDPSDTGEWDKKLPKESDLVVDDQFEIDRLEQRVQAQEWAGLEKNPKAELFVFVGRWSMQKGIDLIADVFPAILESNPNVQLITVGPVIDLHGKFAALKLERLMQLYPTRVCSKPVFTALPPFIFSGAEFALIPSRDEPFGLVAVEFGRKGALGVGARVGGLGQMPGWWFTVESTTTPHLIKQFKEAITEAMESSTETRAKMRARSAKQRFPVAQWVEDLGILQSTSMRIYEKVKSEHKHSSSESSPDLHSGVASAFGLHKNHSAHGLGIVTPRPHASYPAGSGSDGTQTGTQTPAIRLSLDDGHPRDNSTMSSPTHNQQSLGTSHGPGHIDVQDHNDGDAEPGLTAGQDFLPPVVDVDANDIGRAVSMYLDNYDVVDGYGDQYDNASLYSMDEPYEYRQMAKPTPTQPRLRSRDSDTLGNVHEPIPLGNVDQPWPLPSRSRSTTLGTPSQPSTPRASTSLFPPPRIYGDNPSARLSMDSIVGEKTDYNLQQVDPFFTDSTGYYYHQFEAKLKDLDGKNSETANCIEEFLVKSERNWFDNRRNAKLGRTKKDAHSRGPSMMAFSSRPNSLYGNPSAATSMHEHELYEDTDHEHDSPHLDDEFLLGANYKPPIGIANYMQRKVSHTSYNVYQARTA